MTNEERYIIARWMYCLGEEFISDIEYDHLEQDIKSRGILTDYTSRGWSEDPCPVDLLRKYNMEEYIKKSILTFKTESIPSLNSKDAIQSSVCITEPSRLSFKLDGFSLRLNYYNGKLVTAMLRNRADGNDTELLKLMPMFKQNIDLEGRILVCGELYLKTSKFEAYKSLRGVQSQRSAVSTAIANGDIDYLGYKVYSIYGEFEPTADKYMLLESLGFNTPRNIIVTSDTALWRGIDILGRFKSSYDAPTDGLVLENTKYQYALRVGAWEEEVNHSIVKGYVFNRGMYNDAVLVEIEPVWTGMETVKEISVVNLQAIIDNNLQIGWPIAFTKRSGVNSVLDVSKTAELQEVFKNVNIR